jgi:hypothetical protein
MALCQSPLLNSNYCFKDRHCTILATPSYLAIRQNLYVSSNQKNHTRKVPLSSPKLWLGDTGQSLLASHLFTKIEYIFWFHDLQPVEIQTQAYVCCSCNRICIVFIVCSVLLVQFRMLCAASYSSITAIP